MHSTPLAAVFAMMSKIENDAKILEAEVCQGLAESVSAADFKFDAIIPVISAKTGAVVIGQTYEADILLAAYNSKANMMITVNGASVPVENGVGKYKSTAQSAGNQPLNVNISVPKPGGGFEVKNTKSEYVVFAPQAAISAEALNILYVGLDNPLSISVGGVDPANVIPRAVGCVVKGKVISNVGQATNASLTGKNGQYKITMPKKMGDVQIQVSAKLPDGRMKPMGTRSFKVRDVPPPRFKIGMLEFSGSIAIESLKLQSFASAVLDNFVYEGVSFKIVSYKFVASVKKTGGLKFAESKTNSLIPIKQILNLLSSGDIIQFSDIKAVGPSGAIVSLDNASASIK
jgi:gliding motility-associated protein GldM